MHSPRVLFSKHLPTMMNQTCFPPLERLTVQGKQTLNRPFQILIEAPKALQVLGPGISPSSQASGRTTPLPSLGSGLLLFLRHARASGPLHVLLPLLGSLFPILPPSTLFLLQLLLFVPFFCRFPDQAWPLLNTLSWYFFPMKLSTVVI